MKYSINVEKLSVDKGFGVNLYRIETEDHLNLYL